MLRTALLAAMALPAVFAQYTWNVTVGAGGKLAYDPPFITGAWPGDVVNFIFNPKNHSATQSTFASPCTPLGGGFDSGFHNISGDPVVVPFTVTDYQPTWFFCRQTVGKNHCGNGMVFAINPDESGQTQKSFEAFQASANATLNATMSVAATPTETSVYVTPSPPPFSVVTVTVTASATTYATTYSSYANSPAPTPNAQPKNLVIQVSTVNASLTFNPPLLNASIGDTVTFTFYPKAHSVTQSNFANPCRPLIETANKPGFDSGLRPVTAPGPDFTQNFTITINDTAPIWGYCKQAGHCGKGMVFGINAGPDTFHSFQQSAIKLNGTNPNANATVGAGAGSGSATGSGSAPSSTSGSNSGATANLARTGSKALAVVSVFLGLLL